MCLQQRHNVDGVNTVIYWLFLKTDRLSRFQSFVAIHLNGRKMGEQVVVVAVFNNKTVAFGVVEPFHLAAGHVELPCTCAVGSDYC